MHTFSKIFMCVISILGAEFAHAAAPASDALSKKQLVAGIEGDLKNLHTLLAKMMAMPKDALKNHLEHFDIGSLSKLSDAIGECNFSTNYVHEEYHRLHPVGLCKPIAQTESSVQAHHKHGHEQRKAAPASQMGVAAIICAVKPQVAAPLQVATQFEDGNTLGTDTRNLMAKSPKFKMGIEIGSLAKKLVGMTADKQALGAYRPLKRKITTPEDSILRQLQNASEQKLEKFVNFIKALIDGNKPLNEFHLKFHVGTEIANVGEAAQDMSLEQLTPLHALLTMLAK